MIDTSPAIESDGAGRIVDAVRRVWPTDARVARAKPAGKDLA